MKSIIFLFASYCLFESCIHANYQVGANNSQQNDSIVFKEPYIKQRLETDSIEVIKKAKINENGNTFQEVIFLDRKFCNIDKRFVQKEVDSINRNFSFSNYRKYFNDTNAHASNSFPELNSAYVEVKKFHGEYVLADDFTLFAMISDSFLMETSLMEHAFCRIHKSSKEKNIFRFESGWQMGGFTLEVIELDASTGLQIWKSTHKDSEDEYHLKMPLKNALKLPILYRLNDIGEGADYDIDVDKIDLVALFKSQCK